MLILITSYTGFAGTTTVSSEAEAQKGFWNEKCDVEENPAAVKAPKRFITINLDSEQQAGGLCRQHGVPNIFSISYDNFFLAFIWEGGQRSSPPEQHSSH